MVPIRTVEQICFPVLLCPLVSFQVIDTLFREGLQRPYSYPLSPSCLSMSPFSLNQSPTVPVEEGERDPGQASSFSCPSFFGSRHDPRAYPCMDRQEVRHSCTRDIDRGLFSCNLASYLFSVAQGAVPASSSRQQGRWYSQTPSLRSLRYRRRCSGG